MASTDGQAAISHRQLEDCVQGLLDPGGYPGLPSGIGVGATPNPETSASSLQPAPKRNHSGGDPRTYSEKGSHMGGSSRRGILLHPVSGSQEGWQSETGHKSKGPEQLYPYPPLQDGRIAHPQGSTKRLDGESRLEGCLPYISY